MKLPLFSSLAALAALIATAQAQDVSYQKFELDNGLTVILHEDHGLPQVTVNTWYYVASKDELPRRSGFAHLFEHLMFLGTERVPNGEFDTIMEGGGGSNNASTSFDRTNYYDNGPSELLPTLLWLEADRMEALGPHMTQEKLDSEREVVRNERRQSYEDQPYGQAYLETHQLLYPVGHPYHLPVIGTHADLEAATLGDVQDFFAEYYVPNNACLVVAGDFDADVVAPMIEELFGSIPRGADVRHARAQPAPMSGGLVHTLVDRVPFARTSIMWHSPAHFAAGDAELDLVADVLAGGISSRLYRELVVERELAEEVEAYQSSRLLGSHFVITALARPGVELTTLEAAIDEVLAVFLQSGPSTQELERQKAQLEASTLRSLQSIQSKADRLNLYQFHYGEPNSFRRDLDRYREATPEGCLRAAREVFGAQGRLVLRVLPSVEAPETNPRDARPAALPAGSFQPEAPEAFDLSNGVHVLHWQRSELPLVEVGVLLPLGAAHDPEGSAGLASLVAEMLDEGSGELSATDFSDALDLLGASLRTSVEQEATHVRLTALARNFPASLDLLADALLRPRFEAGEWERVQREQISGLQLQLENPVAIARQVSMVSFFGPGHPYGRAVSGDVASVSQLALNDVVGFYSDRYGPAGATILVAGDITTEELKPVLEQALGGWQGLLQTAEDQAVPAFGPPANDSLRVLLVDRPGSVQTVVRILMPTAPYADATRPARELLTTILGGTFTSRLNQNLRVGKGITYGAQSGLAFGPSAAYFVAQAQVQGEHTGVGVREFLAEFARLRGGDVTPDEAQKVRATYRLRVIRSFAGLSGLIGTATGLTLQGLGIEALSAELGQVADLTAEELNAVAAKLLPTERALIVLVGDESVVREQLEGLDLPPIEVVDPSGKPEENR